MIMTDTVLSAELTAEHSIELRYLPDEIKETPLVWVQIINLENDNVSWILQSREYVEKMKPEYGWKPALGLYELLYLAGEPEESTTLTRQHIRNYSVFWTTLVQQAMETYRILRETSESEAPPPRRRFSFEGQNASWSLDQENSYGPPEHP